MAPRPASAGHGHPVVGAPSGPGSGITHPGSGAARAGRHCCGGGAQPHSVRQRRGPPCGRRSGPCPSPATTICAAITERVPTAVHSDHGGGAHGSTREARLLYCTRVVDRRAGSPRRGAGFYCSDAALGGCAATSADRLAARESNACQCSPGVAGAATPATRRADPASSIRWLLLVAWAATSRGVAARVASGHSGLVLARVPFGLPETRGSGQVAGGASGGGPARAAAGSAVAVAGLP